MTEVEAKAEGSLRADTRTLEASIALAAPRQFNDNLPGKHPGPIDLSATTSSSITTWARVASLERMAGQPLVVLALLLLVNAVVLPYHGLYHDARLYAAPIIERVTPGSMADDLYLRYGSQDRYCIFTPLMVPLTRCLGLELSFFVGYLVSKALFFWALLRLVWLLVPERLVALAALVYLAAAPLPFGGNEVFHLNEPFLTPRIAACGLVLLALEQALAGRALVAIGACAGAMVLHPVMALGGLLVVVTWWALRYLPLRLFLALCGLAIVAGGIATVVQPIGYRLFGNMDDEWYEVVFQRNFFIDPVNWSLGDWLRIALVAGCVAASAWMNPRERHFPVALLLVAAVGMAGTLAALHWHYTLLIQASPYRTIWLTDLLGIPLGFRACWLLARQTTGPVPLAAVLLAVALTIDWNPLLLPRIWIIPLLMPLCIIGVRGLRKTPARPDWAARAALWTIGLTSVLLFFLDVRFVVGAMRAPPDFDLDLYPLHVVMWAGQYAFKLPLVMLAIGLIALLGRRIPRSRVLAGALALSWLAYLGVVFALDASPSYSARHSPRFSQVKQATDFLRQRAAGQERPLCVYWYTDLRDIWYIAGAQSYLHVVQMSGCGYNRATALEGKRRAWLVRAFEGPAVHRHPLGDPLWHRAQLDFLRNPANQPPTLADLKALCSDEQLDFAILEDAFDGLYSATTGRWFIYDCAQLREQSRQEQRTSLAR
jgi:hypothetical protein